MPHLTHPLPLHRNMFAPLPIAPLAPFEPQDPMHAQASQRMASVWNNGPAPLAPQLHSSHLLPLFNSGFDTEFVPLEHQQSPQGRQETGATVPVQTPSGVEQKPFSKWLYLYTKKKLYLHVLKLLCSIN